MINILKRFKQLELWGKPSCQNTNFTVNTPVVKGLIWY